MTRPWGEDPDPGLDATGIAQARATAEEPGGIFVSADRGGLRVIDLGQPAETLVLARK